MYMKILKYKKLANGQYKVSLDNRDINLYEDVILKYELLLKKEITAKLLDEIVEFNNECEAYYVALKSLKSRFKSAYDMRLFLLKKEYSSDSVDKAIDKLLNQGYLNDLSYAKGLINNQLVTTNNGPKKIINELEKHRISEEIIYNEIEIFDKEMQLEKIEKLVNRFYKSNKSRGGNILKRKIMTDLINYGYDSELIMEVLNKLDFSVDEEIAKKEYDKLYKRLSRKYEGVELKNKIKEKMYQKGLNYSDEN